ncbi:MAG: acyltransferase [Sphingopyxis sp.]|nr:acyltransferase [Sphingopyxis sp.]
MASLNNFLWLQRSLIRTRILIFNKFWGMDIAPTVLISLTAKLDKTNPKGVHIGEHSIITFGATILAHDMSRRLHTDTFIGNNCFIGARSIVMPGIRVGDGCIVAAGAVVTRDVAPGTIVAGNPAVPIKTGIKVGHYGVLQSD